MRIRDDREVTGRISPGPCIVDRTVRIIGGNELDAEPYLGIKYVYTEITDVPTAYDPDTEDEFIDGIGRGWLYLNNIIQPKRVLIVNDARGSGGTLIEHDRIYASTPIRLTVGADPLVTVVAYVAG
jgi:hypothetical protein